MVSTKHDYLARCRAGIARHKFFDEAPTPELLREAQAKCGELRLPIPRDDKGDVLPYPSTKSKADIFNLEQYKEIDNHALRAPSTLHSVELPELVKYLLKPAQNDVAKVRVIFRWISGQDLLRYKLIPGAPRDSAAMYLNELKQNKGSYESLFRQMCTYAGIPCEKITGYAKGVSYKVGEDVLENARNTWNAVLVDSTWRLIDMQWASRQVVTQDQGEWELIDDGTGAKPAKSDDADVSYDIYAYEEFYFLCDPEEFIYSHFPDEEVWQLLARPVTFAEFNKIAYLRSKFFELDLTVISHPWCVLQAVSGEANLDLGYRSDTMKFSYNLYRSTKVEHKQIQANYDMDKFLFLDAVPDEKTLSMEILFPTTGKFKAELFGRDMTESDTVLKWLCTYVFYCESPKTDCRPLPQNPRKEWGPGSDTISMGMEPLTHKRGKINVDDGEVEVKFALKEDRDFLHKLTTEDNKTLENYTVHHIENGEVVFHARVPGKGQYMLSIMAKEDDEEGGYPSVCNYLLRCEEEFPPLEPFPEIPNGELGTTDEFKRLKLELLDGSHSMITVDKSGHTSFKMKIPKDVEFFAKLGLHTPTGVEDKSEYVSWHRDGDIVTFDLRFAQKGSYRFNLFAKPAGQPGGFPRAFSSIIEVPIPMMVAMSFPEKYAGWTDECKLIEPFNQDIAAKESMEFAAVVPAAKAVAVVGDEWTQLKKDNDGIWRNSVCTIEEGKPMFLSAKFEAEGNSFSHLLKYNVVPKSQLDERAREQSRAHNEAEKEYQDRQQMKEELKKKGEEKRKHEALEKKRRMELQVMDDGERKQLEERFDFEDSGKGDSATANRLEEERKKREEDRNRRVEEIKQRDEELTKKREFPRSAMSDSAWKGRGSKSADALRDQLKLAMRQKNKTNLERAIAECEASRLPELESDLYQAKSVLDTLHRGHLGNVKSPEILRDQLKMATRSKNKQALEKIIAECEASGCKEVDSDLQKAIKAFETLGGARSGPQKIDILREQLRQAIEAKDQSSLEKVIRDCEVAEIPELGSELRKARDMLETISGSRGGVKCSDDLRHKLQAAMSSKNKLELEKAIDECQASGFRELMNDVEKANDILVSVGGNRRGAKSPEALRNQLKTAMRLRSKKDLENAIQEAELCNYPDLQSDVLKAKQILKSLDLDRPGSKSPDDLRKELKVARRSQNKDGLEKIITECEQYAYPELGSDLKEARDTLDSIGGGRGGSKSPDVLRKKLDDAIRRKDKRALDNAIRECVAAGMPSLDDDIQKARTVSDIIGGGAGDIKSSETLKKRLADAISSKDIDSLQKAIQDAEDAGYPELGAQLRKARDTLEAVGGGRGGSKTPDAMRIKLRDAIRKGDKDELESILDEAVAAGMPELDADIYRARKSLDDQDTGSRRGSRRESKTPDTLRDQLRRASRLRDPAALEKLIDEAEQEAYPELGTELCKARDTLESLGGGRGGSKTPDILRQNLEEAMTHKDKDVLDKAIRESVAAGMPELRDSIQKARRLSDILGGGTGEVKSPDVISDQLKKAVRRKDIASLEKAIADAEAAGHPELATELRKARDTLENLGGGRGGSKTPEVLREKLRTTMRDGSKDDLQKVIDECIGAGLPELDSEIERARESLDDTDNGFRRESISPDTLRDQLRRASRQRDKTELEKLIDEAEDAGYPELGYDLRKARESLESLGGGRGGSKSPDALRDILKDAARRKDKTSLDKAISECVAAGLPELDDDIQKARRASDILQGGTGEVKTPDVLRDQIKMAMRKKDKDALDAAITEAERAGYPELGSDLRKARDTLENLGGGRGGTKSSGALRAKLRDSIRRADVDAIESVIGECIAMGMPELDADVQRARGILDGKQDQNGVDKSSDVLRDQLKTAIKQNDKAALQKAIEEAVQAGLPELAYDLRKAKDSLDKLGGGRGDAYRYPTSDYLRDQLKVATLRKDRDPLETLINECETCAYPELSYDLQEARATLQQLGGGHGGTMSPDAIREQLKMAIKQKDRKLLDKGIQEAVTAGFPELESDILQARNTRDTLQGGRGGLKAASAIRDQLKSAIRQKSKPALERAVLDAENARYPELAQDLRDAREALERVGGGRGGKKNPEDLRDKLKMAVRKNDKDTLEKVLEECVAAGFPTLTKDIDQARKVLETLGGGRKGSVSPDTLRDKLKRAMKLKDKQGLEKAIEECVASGHPELLADVQQARETLDSVGGGRKATKPTDVLRDQLMAAMKSKHPGSLERAIAEAEASKDPKLMAEVQGAKKMLDAVWPARAGTPEEVRNLRAKLESAMRRDDTAEMQRLMIEIEQKNLSDYLTVEVGDARNMLHGQQGRAQPDPEGHIIRTDASAESAFASRFGQYTQHGTMSHDLLIAALVVIGESERRLGNWKNFQHFFEMSQADGSTRRVLGLDLEHIYQDLSARADEILNTHSTDEVHLLNRSGMMSYSWSRLMNQEMVSHFSSFNGSSSGGGGGMQAGRTSSSSSFTESAAHMSQTTSRTEFQPHGGSRVPAGTVMGPTTTSSSYQFSQGSRRDGQNGGSGGGFTSYSTSSKYTGGQRRF